MAVYSYPLAQTTPITIAAGADFATETTLALALTAIGTTNINTGNINTQITNFDRNSGAASANTLRTVLATRHEAVGTPLSFRLSDGTDFLTCGAIAASQKSFATAAKALDTVSLIVGWDTANSVHKELAVTATGEAKTTNTDITDRLSGSLVNVKYDNIAVAYNALNDVYTYKLAAATVKTVTITYTDATKTVISTIAAV